MLWRSNGRRGIDLSGNRMKMIQRVLVALAVILAVGSPSWAAPTVVQFKKDVASTTPWVTDGIAEVTFDSDFTVGNTVCIGAGVEANRTLSAISDDGSTSNTYSAPSNGSVNDGNSSAFISCTVVQYAANVVSITLSSATAAPGHIFGVEFSAAAASAPTVGTQLADTTGTAHTIPTLTITGSGPVLWGFGFANGTEIWTLDATYTSQYNANNLVVGYKAVTANDDMANTTASNALTKGLLVEVVEGATATINFFRARIIQ